MCVCVCVVGWGGWRGGGGVAPVCGVLGVQGCAVCIPLASPLATIPPQTGVCMRVPGRMHARACGCERVWEGWGRGVGDCFVAPGRPPASGTPA